MSIRKTIVNTIAVIITSSALAVPNGYAFYNTALSSLHLPGLRTTELKHKELERKNLESSLRHVTMGELPTLISTRITPPLVQTTQELLLREQSMLDHIAQSNFTTVRTAALYNRETRIEANEKVEQLRVETTAKIEKTRDETVQKIKRAVDCLDERINKNVRNIKDVVQDVQDVAQEVNINANKIYQNSGKMLTIEQDMIRMAKGSAAIGVATSNLRYSNAPKALTLSVGMGYNDGVSAIAVGVGYNPTNRWATNVSIATDQEQFVVGGGVSFVF